jgi:hypothetical protein
MFVEFGVKNKITEKHKYFIFKDITSYDPKYLNWRINQFIYKETNNKYNSFFFGFKKEDFEFFFNDMG